MKSILPLVEDKYVLGLSDEGFHRLAYREWCKDPNLPTVVCVHGLTRLSHDFNILAGTLSENYRVICPDMPGRGQSSWFKKMRNYNYIQYCADINTLLARLNVSEVHYVGTSLGGMIGMTLAAMPRSPIKSLTINDAGPEPKLLEMRRLGRYVGKAPTFENKEEAQEYVEQIYGGFGDLTKEQWAYITEYSCRTVEDGFQMHYDPKIGEAFRASYSYYGYNLWTYWDQIECPTLTLRGELSNFLDESTVKRMQARAQNNKLVEIASAAHAPALQSEKEVKIIKDFIDKQEAKLKR